MGGGEHLPFRDESFDLITSNMVIEHMREPKLAFHEMYRVLAPGGTILLHTPNLANYQVFANRVLSKVMPHNLHAFLVWASEPTLAAARPTWPVAAQATNTASATTASAREARKAMGTGPLRSIRR